MTPQKECPGCKAKLGRTIAVCKCGHEFNKFRDRNKKRADPSTRPEFACGPTLDGGFMMMWPRDVKEVLLTAQERALVACVLAKGVA